MWSFRTIYFADRSVSGRDLTFRPTVRQRTIQAISCLSTTGGIYPLSLREIARRIRHEDDDSVLASLLRIFAQSLDVCDHNSVYH